MSHFKGGRRLGKIALGRQDAGEKFKGGRRFSLMMEEREALVCLKLSQGRQEAGKRY